MPVALMTGFVDVPVIVTLDPAVIVYTKGVSPDGSGIMIGCPELKKLILSIRYFFNIT